MEQFQQERQAKSKERKRRRKQRQERGGKEAEPRTESGAGLEDDSKVRLLHVCPLGVDVSERLHVKFWTLNNGKDKSGKVHDTAKTNRHQVGN